MKLSSGITLMTIFLKISHCFGNKITIESENNASRRLVVNRYIEIRLRRDLCEWGHRSRIRFLIPPRFIIQIIRYYSKCGADCRKGGELPQQRACFRVARRKRSCGGRAEGRAHS